MSETAPAARADWPAFENLPGRQLVCDSPLLLECGRELPRPVLAYQTYGELNGDKSNAILVCHALTGDQFPVERHPITGKPGWWEMLIGPGRPIDTDRYFILCVNVIGGCMGSTGPQHVNPDTGKVYGLDFPVVTIKDMVNAAFRVVDHLGIDQLFSVIGGSMGGMHALEWAVEHPDRVARVGVLAAPAFSNADQLALNSVQIEAIRMDPLFREGDYYDEPEGPYRGLALARRMALLNYRSPDELNARFERSWQGTLDPLGHGGRFAVESYLDFHGNKFTRRFDANSYIALVEAMNSHDVTRGRGPLAETLARVTATCLVLGIDSDRLFPVETQHLLSAHLPRTIHGSEAVVISSPFGHDSFLIEDDLVSPHLAELLAS